MTPEQLIVKHVDTLLLVIGHVASVVLLLTLYIQKL